jgi:hypothetical protein
MWLSIIFFILTNLPDIIRIVRMIIDAIRGTDAVSQKEHTRALREAIAAYRKSGDKGPLEALLCKLRGTCSTSVQPDGVELGGTK